MTGDVARLSTIEEKKNNSETGHEVVRFEDQPRARRVGVKIDRRTVTPQLTRLGLRRRRFIDPDGDGNRQPAATVTRTGPPTAQAAGAKAGYVYLHSAIDCFSRLAYTEPLADEKGVITAAFLARAKIWFAAREITHIHRVVTDNGACYRSGDFARIVGARTRHQRTKPYTPRHNGKAERYHRTHSAALGPPPAY